MKERTFHQKCAISFLMLLFSVLVLGWTAHDASAQIQLTSRTELTDDNDTAYIGTNLYITRDEEQTLTAEAIVSRHESNLRGTRSNTNVINMGLVSYPTWLLFSVTNNSSTEDWVLDFGNIWSGRLGLAHKMLVYNDTTKTTFTRALREKDVSGAMGENIHGSAVPIKIRKGQTEVFVVYLELDSGFPNTFTPSLVKEKVFLSKFRTGTLSGNFSNIFFIAVISFFLAIAALHRRPEFLVTAGYFAIHFVIFTYLNTTLFAKFSFMGEVMIVLFIMSTIAALFLSRIFLRIRIEEYTENTLLFGLGVVVFLSALAAIFIFGDKSPVSTLLVFIPTLVSFLALGVVSFLQAQKGKFAGQPFSFAWFIVAAGLSITFFSASGMLPSYTPLLTAYWISFFPQAALLIVASAKKIKMIGEEVKHQQAKESRAAQSKARLQQSKESADQARLLRVIERERELMADLREREMQRTEEMRLAKEMADGANKAKSAFLAVVSHEIRTPMTGIMGIVRLLGETKLTEEQIDYLLAIQKSGDTMMTLLNDILDFEKIETGSMQLEKIDFDLPKLVQGVVTLMSGHAADKGIQLKSDISDDFPRYVIGDPTRLRQVLLNLVNNAIKFTQEGGVTIRLRASVMEDIEDTSPAHYEVYFAVEDSGIGISEEAQKNLFNPFEQADASVSRKFGGTGLGLAICERLIDNMGSTIQVNSEENAGSTFYFVLDMEEGNAERSEEAESMTPSALIKPDAQHKGLRILVVEDNEINRKVLQNFLEKDGHNVEVSESAEQAFQVAQKNDFEMIFTDIQLTGMNGLEFTRKIRAMDDEKLSNIPIIAITGNVGDDDLQQAKEAGVNETLAKPIDYDTLRQLILFFAPEPAEQDRYKEEDTTEFTSKEDHYRQAAADMTEEPDWDVNLTDEDDDTTVPIHAYINQMKGEAEYREDFAGDPPAASIGEEEEHEPEEKEETGEDAVQDFKTDNDQKEPEEQMATSQIKSQNNIFNEAMLQSLKDTLDKESLADLIKGFTTKADEIVAFFEENPDLSDLKIINEKAHELKGMAANFGMTELSAIAEQAENSAKNGDSAAAQTALRMLPDANDRASAAITQWIDNTD